MTPWPAGDAPALSGFASSCSHRVTRPASSGVPAGTPRRREKLGRLPADAGASLEREPASFRVSEKLVGCGSRGCGSGSLPGCGSRSAGARGAIPPQCGGPGQPEREDHRKRGPHGFDGAEELNGRKRHLLVDTLGLVCKVHVTPAIPATVTARWAAWPAGVAAVSPPALRLVDQGYRRGVPGPCQAALRDDAGGGDASRWWVSSVS
jgi:hypothetical protein